MIHGTGSKGLISRERLGRDGVERRKGKHDRKLRPTDQSFGRLLLNADGLTYPMGEVGLRDFWRT
jgi:hypothetical protein